MACVGIPYDAKFLGIEQDVLLRKSGIDIVTGIKLVHALFYRG